ncbi:hypothetical protein N7517_010441 [Penicillium concentricum]|uniref:Uncharacterized protein n=1 Tax=Penicillium concentricum TaxID=293559 RepID=A0A9W9R8U4_9EURO|nr:uncharacterized protein N7517_010441 [Penicillium concentricum]KAJ5355832.1 hypothetical protein N7517_010441 [Penicillium concentricum]
MRSNERTERVGVLHTVSLLPFTSSQGHTDNKRVQTPLEHELENDTIAHRQKHQNVSIWMLFSKVFIWEILAMILSTVLLLAIVMVLDNYNHRPQPTWKYVSLNSVISWLGTIAKACVLFSISEALGQLKWVWFTQKRRPMSDLRTFDSASRGIYGSAELIWNLRARHFAVLGCLAVILALGFDPFTQNLIEYYPKLVADSTQTAIVSISSTYDALGPPRDASNYIEPGMKANIYNAVFNSDSSKPWSIPRFSCTSGNCTWDPAATMAMGASCANITEKLDSRCSIITDDSTGSGYKGFNNCSSHLPGGDRSMGGTLAVNYILNSSIGTLITIGSIGRFVYKDTIINPVQIIANDPDDRTKWQAFECALRPIVRSFRAKVIEGEYQEETLGIWQDAKFSSESMLRGHYRLQPPWGPDMGMEHNKTFIISQEAIDTIQGFFPPLFTGRMENNGFGQVIKPNTNTIHASGDVIQAISSQASNITGCTVQSAEKLRCAVENVAAAMSKSFRDTALSTQENSNITGKAMTSKTYVSIHWQWIALPILVWFLGLLTLVGVIWKTRKISAPTWKNDVMPLLSICENGHENGYENAKTEEKVSGAEKMNIGRDEYSAV